MEHERMQFIMWNYNNIVNRFRKYQYSSFWKKNHLKVCNNKKTIYFYSIEFIE